jgi:hypothetical protein
VERANACGCRGAKEAEWNGNIFSVAIKKKERRKKEEEERRPPRNYVSH